jgi:hypothetical protein
MKLSSLFTISLIISSALLPLDGAYQQVGSPRSWTLKESTPSWSDSDKRDFLGNLKPRVKLKVTEVIPGKGVWRLRYDKRNGEQIFAYIEIPDLSKYYAAGFSAVESSIAEFPLLERLFEIDPPWSGNFLEAIDADTSSLWGMRPLSISRNQTGESPSIVLEIWNKGDAFQSEVNPSQANTIISQNLSKFERFFRLEGFRLDLRKTKLGAIKEYSKSWVLPNDILATLSYASREYLILKLESYSEASKMAAEKPDAYAIADRLTSKKRSPAGHIYISGIPMINQGNKGYCAPATLTRLTKFLGYNVDLHQLADITETKAQYQETDSGGAYASDIISATRRIFSSTPYRLRQIGLQQDDHYEAIRLSIDSDQPIIWMVPGHMRLIIGYHPRTREIVYSDSWGSGHEFKTMDWNDYMKYNEQMWVLELR